MAEPFKKDEQNQEIYYLTKYEYTRIRGYREEQLAHGAIPYVKLSPEEYSKMSINDIFMKEFNEKKIPIQICRTYPNGGKIVIPFESMNLSLLQKC